MECITRLISDNHWYLKCFHWIHTEGVDAANGEINNVMVGTMYEHVVLTRYDDLMARNDGKNWGAKWREATITSDFSKTRQWRKYSDILLMYLFHLATFSLQKYFLSTSTFCEVLTSTHFKLTSFNHGRRCPPSPSAVLFQPDINQTSPLTTPDPGTT